MQRREFPGSEPTTATNTGGYDAPCGSTPSRRDMETATLGRRMAEGEVEAMDLFYDLTCEVSYGLACHLLGDRGDAESLLCDAYLFGWRAIRVAPPVPGSERQWILCLVIDRYRAALARPGSTDEDK